MKTKIHSGQSLFEVVIAVGIIALIITGTTAVALNSIQNSAYARDKNLATNYVQETMEWLRQVRNNDTTFKTKITQPGFVYCFASLPHSTASAWPSFQSSKTCLPIPDTIFSRYVEIIDCPDPQCPENVARVTTTVTWQDSKGNHEVSSATDLSIK